MNTKGLHARASAKFVEVVDAHEARVTVGLNGTEVPGDSIMGLMSLGAAWGTVIDVEVTGPQEQELAQALQDLIGNCFGEGS